MLLVMEVTTFGRILEKMTRVVTGVTGSPDVDRVGDAVDAGADWINQSPDPSGH
jgi:hypothetical protein